MTWMLFVFLSIKPGDEINLGSFDSEVECLRAAPALTLKIERALGKNSILGVACVEWERDKQ